MVELPNGCPSVDTFVCFLQLKLQSLYICLEIYGKDLISDVEGKHIVLDGKQLRGSKHHFGYTHVFSVWVDEFGLSIAQERVEEKRNEL